MNDSMRALSRESSSRCARTMRWRPTSRRRSATAHDDEPREKHRLLQGRLRAVAVPRRVCAPVRRSVKYPSTIASISSDINERIPEQASTTGAAEPIPDPRCLRMLHQTEQVGAAAIGEATAELVTKHDVNAGDRPLRGEERAARRPPGPGWRDANARRTAGAAEVEKLRHRANAPGRCRPLNLAGQRRPHPLGVRRHRQRPRVHLGVANRIHLVRRDPLRAVGVAVDDPLGGLRGIGRLGHPGKSHDIGAVTWVMMG